MPGCRCVLKIFDRIELAFLVDVRTDSNTVGKGNVSTL